MTRQITALNAPRDTYMVIIDNILDRQMDKMACEKTVMAATTDKLSDAKQLAPR